MPLASPGASGSRPDTRRILLLVRLDVVLLLVIVFVMTAKPFL
jgi:hypothetical protein